MKNKLKREVLLIILLSLVVTVILNLSIQYISDRFFDDEVDDYIMRVIEKGEPIDRRVIEQMDDLEFNRSMIINLISICICGLLLWVFIKKKTKYIKELSDSLIYIGEGNLDYEVPLREHNELTELAGSINELSVAFKTMIEKEKAQSEKEKDFIVGISHDIRSPLTSIIGYLHVIKDHQYQTDDERENYMNIILNKVYDLKELTDALLDDARELYVNNEKKHYNQELFTIATINRITDALKSEFEVNVHWEVDEFIPFEFSSLDRVIDNLISNIQKYALVDESIELIVNRNDLYLELSISNSSHELLGEQVKRFTDRFYRADSSRTLTQGHGLGLSICKSIMEENDGYINVSHDATQIKITLGIMI